jgi:hypothetical protein
MEQLDNDNNDNDKLIKEWLIKLNIKPISSKVISLNEYALYNLIDLYYTSKNIKGKKYKTIKKNDKIIIQIYNKKLLNLFYKKQVNSNWTYVKNNDMYNYDIRFNITIYLYQSDIKSYKTTMKKNKTDKTDKNNDYNSNTKKTKTNLSDFFDIDSD